MKRAIAVWETISDRYVFGDNYIVALAGILPHFSIGSLAETKYYDRSTEVACLYRIEG